jgi:serine phosphatase RsbU (regulator of sigma subunit)
MTEELIGRVPLFTSLPQPEIAHLAHSLRPFEFPAGTILFHEDRIEDHFYILMEGEVEVITSLGTSDERLLGVREAVSFIGEMSLFNREGKHTASVRALSPLHVLEMTRLEFDQLLHRQPLLAYEMVRVMSTRLQESENATIHDLQLKNQELTQAYNDLKAAHLQIVEKEKLERELAVAREIQQSILPRTLPDVKGLDFGGKMSPTRAVAGDFYDMIWLSPDEIGIVVGDVSDKGVPASLFMALTYSLIRAEASRAVKSPRDALLTVNRLLLDMNASNMFVTVLYGILNCVTLDFHYVRAGHNLPIVLDAHGQEVPLASGIGQPLGMLPQPEIDEQRLQLEDGGTLLIYTDGVSEAFDTQRVMFGEKRLAQLLRELHPLTAQQICDRIDETVNQYTQPAQPHDDITLVTVKVNR